MCVCVCVHAPEYSYNSISRARVTMVGGGILSRTTAQQVSGEITHFMRMRSGRERVRRSREERADLKIPGSRLGC